MTRKKKSGAPPQAEAQPVEAVEAAQAVEAVQAVEPVEVVEPEVPTQTDPPPPASGPSDTVMPPEGWDEVPTVNLVGEDSPTVNLTGDAIPFPVRDDETAEDREAGVEEARELSEAHLRGLLEALVFASDKPMKAGELARLASAPVKHVREVLAELKASTAGRGVVLDEVAGGWIFRTAVQYAPFVRELTSEKPVRLTRAQVETLAIVAYRQPITRPEVDDIRGVDSGATLKLLLERDLVRILGKKDEPGRPILYGTTNQFLEFFGLKSLKDLPTLKEFTELTDESRRVAEAELGEVLPDAATTPNAPVPPMPPEEEAHSDTLTPPAEPEHDTIAPPPPPPTDGEIDGGTED